jgi:hypothetical protein
MSGLSGVHFPVEYIIEEYRAILPICVFTIRQEMRYLKGIRPYLATCNTTPGLPGP